MRGARKLKAVTIATKRADARGADWREDSASVTHPYRSLFSYYGGKSKLVQHYPPPRHDVVIEPFAGGASYALRYHERTVILNDSDPDTAAIWHYFLTTDLNAILAAIPEQAPAGKRVSDMVDVTTAPRGLVALLRSAANQGTQGARGVRDVVSPYGANCWSRLRQRLAYWYPRTRHWSIYHGDYTQLDNQAATWFIDPPYFNAAGAQYRQSDLDYDALARWCVSRRGQVMVCENDGATWLPFKPLIRAQGVNGKHRAMESIWTGPSRKGALVQAVARSGRIDHLSTGARRRWPLRQERHAEK